LSVLYAVAYLGIAPAAQRGSNVDAFYRSCLAHPAGLRIASACLLVSGVVIGVAVVALAGRFPAGAQPGVTWATIVGVTAGLATAAHGLSDLVGVDKLAHRYATGDSGTGAAAAVSHLAPSATDPRGLATFGAAGLVVFALGMALRPARRYLGTLGIVLGADLLVLFLADALGLNALVLVTGGLASVVLGPIWWVGVAWLLWTPSEVRDPDAITEQRDTTVLAAPRLGGPPPTNATPTRSRIGMAKRRDGPVTGRRS
jgi:hypothetical protein